MKRIHERTLNLTFAEVFRFMMCLHPSFPQHLVDSILGEGRFTITDVNAEQTLKSRPDGYEARVDALGTSLEGVRFHFEMQTGRFKSFQKRMRLYQAMIDSRQLTEGENVMELHDTISIAFVGKDIFGLDKPLYVARMGLEDVDCIPDYGFKHYYVNLAYKGRDTPLGQLIGDLLETDPDKMSSEIMKNALQSALKGDNRMYTHLVEGGPAEAIEYLVAQGEAKGVAKGEEKKDKENVLRFATLGVTPEQTATLLNLPLEKVKSILEVK